MIFEFQFDLHYMPKKIPIIVVTPKCLCDHFLVAAFLSRAVQCKRTYFLKKICIIFSEKQVLNLMMYLNFSFQ